MQERHAGGRTCARGRELLFPSVCVPRRAAARRRVAWAPASSFCSCEASHGTSHGGYIFRPCLLLAPRSHSSIGAAGAGMHRPLASTQAPP